MASKPALHDLATLAGAMPVGAQFLFTTEQLARLVTLAGGASEMMALHDRAERAGIKVTLIV